MSIYVRDVQWACHQCGFILKSNRSNVKRLPIGKYESSGRGRSFLFAERIRQHSLLDSRRLMLSARERTRTHRHQ